MSGAVRLPEVPVASGALVLGDLHLDVSPRAASESGFERWLRAQAGLPQLIVLGDLFDAWVGPAHARLAPARAVCELLRERSRSGTRIDVLPGNRDFLLDERFERDTGARLHPRGFVGLLPGPTSQRALFVHGDELCTLDRSYQRLKRVLRSGPVRWLAPRLPSALALRAASGLRARSRTAVQAKPPAQKEQQQAAALALALSHGCSTLVCGHAHRFRDQLLEGGVRWRVVDAFGAGRDLLRVDPRGELAPLSSEAITPAGAPPGGPAGGQG